MTPDRPPDDDPTPGLLKVAGVPPPGSDQFARFWEELVARFGPRMHAWACRRGLDDATARDAVQDVFVRLLRNWSYDPNQSLRSYLSAAVANAFRGELRHRGRHPDHQGRGHGEADPDLLRAIDDGLGELPALRDDWLRSRRPTIQEVVRRVQDQVAPRDWQVFCLRYVPQSATGKGLVARAVADALNDDPRWRDAAPLTTAQVFAVEARVKKLLNREFASAGIESGNPETVGRLLLEELEAARVPRPGQEQA
jgi:RNA polymerase sigma factor (sigma-70 family)